MLLHSPSRNSEQVLTLKSTLKPSGENLTIVPTTFQKFAPAKLRISLDGSPMVPGALERVQKTTSRYQTRSPEIFTIFQKCPTTSLESDFPLWPTVEPSSTWPKFLQISSQLIYNSPSNYLNTTKVPLAPPNISRKFLHIFFSLNVPVIYCWHLRHPHLWWIVKSEFLGICICEYS